MFPLAVKHWDEHGTWRMESLQDKLRALTSEHSMQVVWLTSVKNKLNQNEN